MYKMQTYPINRLGTLLFQIGYLSIFGKKVGMLLTSFIIKFSFI